MNRLAAYLSERKIPEAVFARELGVSPSTIHRVIRGERRPSYGLMQRIAEKTKGQVPPGAFFEPAEPAAPTDAAE